MLSAVVFGVAIGWLIKSWLTRPGAKGNGGFVWQTRVGVLKKQIEEAEQKLRSRDDVRKALKEKLV
ncbi:MAG: hypothetical protein ACE5H3_02485 [Planctomycetota bacterium]